MKAIKRIISKKELFTKKKLENKKPLVYTVDTFDNNYYICFSEKRIPVDLLGALELKARIEKDNVNTYVFTKEAYAQCEKYFEAFRRAREIVVA